MDKTLKSDIKIVTRDFDTKVGLNKTWLKLWTSNDQHGFSSAKENYEIFSRPCFGGMIFPYSNVDQYIWTSPDGKSRTQITDVHNKWQKLIKIIAEHFFKKFLGISYVYLEDILVLNTNPYLKFFCVTL